MEKNIIDQAIDPTIDALMRNELTAKEFIDKINSKKVVQTEEDVGGTPLHNPPM